jgi:hypothetical protein
VDNDSVPCPVRFRPIAGGATDPINAGGPEGVDSSGAVD